MSPPPPFIYRVYYGTGDDVLWKNFFASSNLCFIIRWYILIIYISQIFRLTTVKYVPGEDEISMGAVSTIVTPKHENRPIMKEYYS